MMVSFVYTCINTVKVITVEKERQLKASNPLVYYLEYLESFYKINWKISQCHKIILKCLCTLKTSVVQLN